MKRRSFVKFFQVASLLMVLGTPVLAIAIIFFVSELAERGLIWLYAHRIF